MHRIASDVDLIELDATFIRAKYPGDHIEGGGLSSTIRANESEQIPGLDLEVNPVQGLERAVRLREVFIAKS